MECSNYNFRSLLEIANRIPLICERLITEILMLFLTVIVITSDESAREFRSEKYYNKYYSSISI